MIDEKKCKMIIFLDDYEDDDDYSYNQLMGE